MKRFLLTLLCLAGIRYAHAQVIIEFSKEKRRSKTIARVDVEDPKGDTSLRSYLERNLNASTEIGKRAKKGKYTVVIHYVVSKDGSIADIICKEDPGYGMCKEAVRIMKKYKFWVPAQQNGRTVSTYRH